MAAALLSPCRAKLGLLNTAQELPGAKRCHSPQQAEERGEKALNRTAPDSRWPVLLCLASPSSGRALNMSESLEPQRACSPSWFSHVRDLLISVELRPRLPIAPIL